LIFAAIGLIIIAGNLSLAVNRKVLEQKIAGNFKHEVTVGPAFYIFPNIIILNNIKIKKKLDSKEKTLFVLPKITINFSLRELFFNGLLNIYNITVHPSDISYYAVSQFIEDNIQEILGLIRKSAGGDMNIRIKEALLDFDRKGRPDYVATEHHIRIRGDSIKIVGLFRTDLYEYPEQNGGIGRRIAKGWPLGYQLNGQLLTNGLAFDHLIFKGGNVYSKLWGSIKNNWLKIDGFMFVDTSRRDAKNPNSTYEKYG